MEYASWRIRGPVPLSVGQDSAAVGVLHACLQSDVCTSTHRNHAHCFNSAGERLVINEYLLKETILKLVGRSVIECMIGVR